MSGRNVGTTTVTGSSSPPVGAGLHPERARAGRRWPAASSSVPSSPFTRDGRTVDLERRRARRPTTSMHPVGQRQVRTAGQGEQLAEALGGPVDAGGVASPLEPGRGLGAQVEALGGAGDGHRARSRRPRAGPGWSPAPISEEAPPMIPPMPTGAPVASQIRQSWPVSPRPGPGRPSVRSTPSRVVTVSPAAARRTSEPAAGQPVEVVGVGGLAELQHHVVGGVDHVVDRAHAGGQVSRRASHVGRLAHRAPRSAPGR